MTRLFVDLETIPTQRADVIAEIKRGVHPSGSMSKPETIERWRKNVKPLLVDKAYRKTALNGTLGEIICIGYAINDEPAVTSGRTLGDPEYDILTEFFGSLKPLQGDVEIIGHCVADFDLKFLYQGAVVNNVQPPTWFPTKDVKAWSKGIFDTKEQWVGKSSASGSLEAICKALGIEGKGDIDGSKVWDYIKAGRYEEVFKYCGEDVERTRQLYYRMNFM